MASRESREHSMDNGFLESKANLIHAWVSTLLYFITIIAGHHETFTVE